MSYKILALVRSRSDNVGGLTSRTYLAVHQENGKCVYFNANNVHQVNKSPRKMTLTDFFQLCSHVDFVKTLFYNEKKINKADYITLNDKIWIKNST
jgi:hypothetical protein